MLVIHLRDTGSMGPTPVQVQLVVCLRIIPLACRYYLGDNLPLIPFLVDFLCDVLGNFFLLRIVVEDGTPVLRTVIGALRIRRGRVVHSIEELEQRAVGDLLRVIYDLESLGIYCSKSAIALRVGAKLLTSSPSTADGAIAGVVCITSDVPNARVYQSLVAKVLPVHVLDSPEAARRNGCFLSSFRNRHRSYWCLRCGGERSGDKIEDPGHKAVNA